MVVFMIVAHNLLAMNANRQFNINTNLKAKSTEKLSSGYKINRASDDAAGLSISEKMRWQIRGLNRGSKNIQDGISLTQVADGALNEVHSMVHRIRELAIQSANGTNSDEDRAYIQEEVKQIKKEISRTFNTTDFNGMEIFRTPYTLGVSGEPNDIKMFNTTQSSAVSARGGFIFDNRRYTWGELGASVSNGVFTEDFAYKATGANGETIDLEAKKGDSVNDVKRYYQVTSDQEGIYVNGKPAARWEDTSESGKWSGVNKVSFEDNTYSFYYNGVDISFTVEEGDDRDTVINNLNPDEFSSKRTMYYTAEVAGGKNEIAVVSSASITPMILDVTESNKYNIEDFTYQVSADESGVTITQTNGSDGITHKKIAWSDFVNVNSGEAFSFTDWGLEDEGSNPVTFSSQAIYKYEDNTTTDMESAISFTFTVKDEASKAAVIAGLNGIRLTGGDVYAPLLEEFTTDNVNVDDLEWNRLDDFVYQRDVLARTFDNNASAIEGDMIRFRNYSRGYDDTIDTYIDTYTMEEVYVRRINEVLDDDGNVVDTYYTEEKLTSQSVSDSDTITDDEGRVIRYSYEKNDGESFALYKKNGTGYESISGQLYEVDTNGEIVGNDDEHTHFSEATGTTQKYVITASGKSIDKTYRIYNDNYSFINSNGDEVMSSRFVNIEMLDVIDGVVDWKGRPVDTSDVGNPSLFTITNKDGSTRSMRTQFLPISGGTTDYSYGTWTRKAILLNYNNANSPADGSDNNNVHLYIYPDGEATRTFTKSYRANGSSYRTDFDSVAAPPPKKNLWIQAGPQQDNGIDLEWSGMSLSSIGLGGANVSTQDGALRTIGMCDTAIEAVSEERSTFGAYQNRLEHSFNVNSFTAENLDTSESRIRDTDMAEEMVRYTKQNILEQAVMSMLSQANQSQQGVLSLLAG